MNNSHFETAGACGGTLGGAAIGAKVGTSIGWISGPLYPAIIGGSTAVGAILGFLAGKFSGRGIDTHLE
jgi:hypothetical protein